MSFVRSGRVNRALDATRLRAAIFQAIEGTEGTLPSAARSEERESEGVLSA